MQITFKRLQIVFSLICISLFFLLPSSALAKKIDPSGWSMIKGKPVSPKKAAVYFKTKKEKNDKDKNQQSQALVRSAVSTDPRIIELARALQHDPILIYEYVRNHIDYKPYYGAMKGAVLTLLDGSGNDFDQAALLVSLLRASGYTAEFVHGTITVPDSEHDLLANWLRIDQDSQNIANMIYNGGIPIAGNYTSLEISHVWVKVTEGTDEYLLDPSFKSYNQSPKIDLGLAIGYDRNSLLTAVTNGASIGTDSVQNLNDSSLRSLLEQHTSDLATYLQNDSSNSTVADVIGAQTIIPEYFTALPTSLAFATSDEITWTDDIPIEYTASLTVQHQGIDHEFYTPDIAGKRLSLTYRQSDNAPELRLEGELIATGNPTTAGSKADMVLSFDHPYPAPNGAGTFHDKSHTHKVESGRTYIIISEYGGTNHTLLSARQKVLEEYRISGLADTTEKVLGESLNIMGLTWLQECNLNTQLIEYLSETVSVHHHTVGVMAQEAGYYIDIPNSSSSRVSRHNIESDRKSSFYAQGFVSSGFEHGMLEQLMGSDKPGASTIKLLHLANSSNTPIYLADSNNYSSIRPLLDSYATAQLDAFQTQVSQGRSLIIPKNGLIPLNQWHGLTYLSRYETSTDMSLGFIIGGGYFGGFASTPGNTNPEIVSQVTETTVESTPSPASSGLSASIAPQRASREPVEMASGAYIFDHTDLPGALPFHRSYSSAKRFENMGLGYGWNHNYDIYLSEGSSGAPGLGVRTPEDMASMLAAMYINLDLFKNEDSLTGWVTAALISKWAIDQLIDNTVTVQLGGKSTQFVKQPDGSFTSPPGITATLTHNGSTYQLEERFGKLLMFNSENQAAYNEDADGNRVTFGYNTNNQLISVTDSFNHSLTLAYTGDSLNSVTGESGRIVSYGLSTDDLTSYTDPEGKIYQYGYDSKHRMTSLSNPLGITTATNIFNSLDQVVQQTVPRQTGNAVYNFFFSDYRNIEEDPEGNQLIYYFDQKGRSIADENELGHTVSRGYDGQDHTIEATDAKGNSISLSYDGKHNLLSSTNPLGQVNNYSYDSQHRLIESINPLAHKVNFTYDSEHHLGGATTYPASGRSITTAGTFLANGLPHTNTDGRGITSTFSYDSYGNPVSSTLDTEPPVQFSYDSTGRITSLTDQSGNTTSFTYDNRGLLASKTDPFNKVTSYSYSDDAKLQSVTDRNDQTSSYTYTTTGKIETVSFYDGSGLSYTYDQHNRLTQITDSSGSLSYTYDPAGRLISSTDIHGFTLGYSYDKSGNLTKLTYPDTREITYVYDELNRLTQVLDGFMPFVLADYSYDAAGRLTEQANHNGTRTNYSYDDATRLTSVANTTSAGEVISSYSFTLDGNGNRVSVERTGPVKSAVNLENISATFEKNSLRTAGSSTYSQDFEGQRTSRDTTSYTFDARHRVTGADTTNYLYDPASKRAQANQDGVITRYIYDANGNLLAEADQNNQITCYYIYGLGLIGMQENFGSTFYYHFDALGNTDAITDSTQQIVNYYAYSPFGVILNQKETIPQPFKYVGQHGVMSEDNGLYYMRARYYDPQVGRFISEDPLGFDGGDVNLYGYVSNDPVNFVDPGGLLALGVHFGGGAGIGKGGTNSGKPNYVSGSFGAVFGSSQEGGSAVALTSTGIVGNIAGASIGAGPEVSAYFGDVEEMSGDGGGGIVIVGGASLTVTKDASGNWGISFSVGGKGFGLGATFFQSGTANQPYWDSDYGKENCE